MNPNETLSRARAAGTKLKAIQGPKGGPPISIAALQGAVVRDFQDLDTHLLEGGELPVEWDERCNGGLLKRARLAIEVYQTVFDATESLEGDLGMFLAYLLGAIIKGSLGGVQIDMEVLEEVEVLGLFEDMFPKDHPVWQFFEKA